MALDIALGNQNADNGCFNFVRGADGDVAFDETGAHGVVTSVVERKGTNVFDRSHGTNIWQMQSLTSRTPSQAEAEAIDGATSLEDAGEIQGLSATAAVGSFGRLNLDVSWKSGDGELQSKTIEV